MSASNRRTVLCDDPYVTWDDAMQFRLTYEGILCSTGFAITVMIWRRSTRCSDGILCLS